jgi:hypothetical protein
MIKRVKNIVYRVSREVDRELKMEENKTKEEITFW